MLLTRRRFLAGSGLAAAAASPLARLFEREALAATATACPALVPDPRGLLDLPPGFSYRVVDHTGDRMSDGYGVPGAPDGMACFPGSGGKLVLVRNHELDRDAPDGAYARGRAPAEAYDAGASGAVTRVVLDGATLERTSSNLVLTGTMRNCAGGPSPWGWLSCEEDTTDGHGFVFLCDPSRDHVASPARIAPYGRFNHEAVAVDPHTNVAYFTEDQKDGALYRFVPDHPTWPFGGKLQALVLADAADTATSLTVGQHHPVRWVTLEEPCPKGDTLRREAASKGAARFVRNEGIWMHEGSVYFCATAGGPTGSGQIFHLTPERPDSPAVLTLLAQAQEKSPLDCPDNITMSPWGALFFCEGKRGDQLVRVLDARGRLAAFARNARSKGELAGVCFAPGGRALFLNMQADGITLAVTGPFRALLAH